MTSPFSSKEEHNFHCVIVASLELINLPLIDILTNKISPKDLYTKINSCSALLQGDSKLRPEQLKVCYLQPPATPDYSKFDVTLLYKLIRNLCSLPSPRQGWGKEPEANDIQISDDIERLRLFRNNYQGHANSASIPDAVFQDIWKNLEYVIKRIKSSIKWSVDYEEKLFKLERTKFDRDQVATCLLLLQCYMDSHTENAEVAGFLIKGEDKVICGGIGRLEASLNQLEPLITWQKRKCHGKVFEDINTGTEKYSGSTKRILVIQSVCKEDEGEYRAVLAPTHENSRNTINLHVLGELPSLNDLRVTTGVESITIHYSYEVLELSPKVHDIKWSINDEPLDMNTKKFVGGSIKETCFSILLPSTENTGKYCCTVFNAVGSVSKHVMLDFPSAIISVHPKKVLFGSTIKIMSEVYSTPTADKLEWQKSVDGNTFVPIDISKPNYYKSNLNPKSPVLVIPKATFEDKLYYRLAIWNKFGQNVSNTVELKITGSVPNITTSQITNIGERSVSLSGNVFLYPDSPTIQDVYWTKDGKKIDIAGSGGRLSFDIENKKLIIKPVGKDDAGNYKLTATNSVGSTTSDTIVLGPPYIFIERTENKETGSQKFTATIKSVPTPYEISWGRKGICDDRFQQIDVCAEEYKGTTISLPHPVLVLNQKSQLENNSYQITVKNFVGSAELSELEEFHIKEDSAMAFPLTFAQDVLFCVQCGDSANYYCKPCSLKLCWKCTKKHLNETNHENVESTPERKIEKPYPECNSHVKKTCELYCKDCNTPICCTCVTGDHRNHNYISIEDFLENKKEDLNEEVQKIRATVLLALNEQTSHVNEDDYKNIIDAISSQEKIICKAVQEVSSKLKSQVERHREENIENENKRKQKEKEILKIFQDTTLLLERNNPREILECKNIRPEVNTCPFVVDITTPVFKRKNICKEEIKSLFGTLGAYRDDNIEIGSVDWFHGFILKQEAEQLVKKNGDFLVWEMMNNADQNHYIISSYYNGALHFKVTSEYIVSTIGHKTSLVALIDYLVSSGQPLSKDNPSTLQFPVTRSRHQLDSCHITLGPKIENISTGDILSGTFGTQKVLVCINKDHEIRLHKNIYFLRIFKHPNIVKMEGYSSLRKPVLLVLENMAGGSLLTYLRSNAVSISSKLRSQMCHNVATGMEYLHLNKFIHGEVAARNCLVTENGVAKVCDFWMTEKEEDYQQQRISIERQLPVHIRWTAPETLEFGTIHYLSDVWSFGILMWEIFSSGKCPYPQFTDAETKKEVMKGYKMDSPENTPRLCYNLMQKCWEKKSAKRLSFKDLVIKLQTEIKKQK